MKHSNRSLVILMDLNKTWMGRYFQQKGSVILDDFENIGQIGFSTGKKKKINEDCLRVGKYDNDYYLAVADGHWGYLTSENVINNTVTDFLPILKNFSEKNLEINRVLTELTDILWNHGQESKSETSFVIAYTSENNLCWFSFGDSFLFAIDKDWKQYQNIKKSKWLGKRVINKEELRSFCDFDQIKNQQNVLVMSDGITECIFGIPTILSDEIFAILANNPDPVKILIIKAMECGDEDNIAIAGISNQI